MDKRIQLFLTTLIFWLGGFAQCTDSIKVEKAESCARVSMPEQTFVEFYLAKRNLEMIGNMVPRLDSIVDSLHAKNAELETNLLQQVDSANAKSKILENGLDDCYKELVDIDLENMYLRYEVSEFRHRRIRIFGFGLSVGTIGTVIAYKLATQ